jgi:uncharacterized membrane protein
VAETRAAVAFVYRSKNSLRRKERRNFIEIYGFSRLSSDVFAVFCHLPLPCKGLTTKQQKISVHPKNYVFVLVSLSALGVFGVFLCVK